MEKVMEWKRIRKNKRLIFGGGIVLLLITVAIFAPLLAPHDPLKMYSKENFAPISKVFPLGADEYGRDMLSRLIFGARVSMMISTSGVILSTVAGVILGLIGAYYGGWIDTLIMRTMDVIMCFPTIVLAIAIVAFLGSNKTILAITIGFLYMPGVTRIIYSTALTIKFKEYVIAAEAIGARKLRIMYKTILPNTMGPLLVRISLNMGFAILLESSLGFLGLGTRPPTPSWGAMISIGRGFMEMQPFMVIWPAIVISVAVLSFNTLGDGLRDMLDPRLRER
jgi:peptide/nickel transport system permease protein